MFYSGILSRSLFRHKKYCILFYDQNTEVPIDLADQDHFVFYNLVINLYKQNACDNQGKQHRYSFAQRHIMRTK